MATSLLAFLIIAIVLVARAAGECFSPTPTGDLTNTSGTILSDADGAGAEVPYADENECEWTIRCPNGTKIFITSVEGTTELDYDFFTIFDPATDEFLANDVTGELSESTVPVQLTNTDTLVVTFVSDASVNDRGFTLNYQCYGDVGPEFDCAAHNTAPAYDYYRPDGMCNGGSHMTDCRNTFFDCTFNASCAALMACMHQHYACMESLPEQVEGSSCYTFYEQMLAAKMLLAHGASYDGSALQASCLKTTCEDVGRQATVCPVYAAQACVAPDVSYLITPAPTPVPPVTPAPTFACNATTPQGVLTESSGTILSDADGSGEFHAYANNDECQWTVTCPASTTLFLDVEGELENGFDFLEIIDPLTSESITAVTGDVRDGFLLGLTSYQTLTFRFTSDESEIESGFTISYQCFSSATNGPDSCAGLSSTVPGPTNPYLPPEPCVVRNNEVFNCMADYDDCESTAFECVEVMVCIRERNLCLEHIIEVGGLPDDPECGQWSMDFEQNIVATHTRSYAGSDLEKSCLVAACNASADSYLAFLNSAACGVNTGEVCALPPVPTTPPTRPPNACYSPIPTGEQPTTSGLILSDEDGSGTNIDYARDSHCLWIVKCDARSLIELHVQGYTETNYDIVNITDPTTGESVAVGSGLLESSDVNMGLTPYRDLHILFTSDDSEQRSGFTINYTCRSQAVQCNALPTLSVNRYSPPSNCGISDMAVFECREIERNALFGGPSSCEEVTNISRAVVNCYNSIAEAPSYWSTQCKQWLEDLLVAKQSIRSGASYGVSPLRDSCRALACEIASSPEAKAANGGEGCPVVADEICLESTVVAIPTPVPPRPTLPPQLTTPVPGMPTPQLTIQPTPEPVTELPTEGPSTVGTPTTFPSTVGPVPTPFPPDTALSPPPTLATTVLPSTGQPLLTETSGIATLPPTVATLPSTSTPAPSTPLPLDTPSPGSDRGGDGAAAAPEDETSSNTTTIAVGIVVAAVVLGIIACVVVYLIRRRSHKQSDSRYRSNDYELSSRAATGGKYRARDDDPAAGDERFRSVCDELERFSDESGDDNGIGNRPRELDDFHSPREQQDTVVKKQAARDELLRRSDAPKPDLKAKLQAQRDAVAAQREALAAQRAAADAEEEVSNRRDTTPMKVSPREEEKEVTREPELSPDEVADSKINRVAKRDDQPAFTMPDEPPTKESAEGEEQSSKVESKPQQEEVGDSSPVSPQAPASDADTGSASPTSPGSAGSGRRPFRRMSVIKSPPAMSLPPGSKIASPPKQDLAPEDKAEGEQDSEAPVGEQPMVYSPPAVFNTGKKGLPELPAAKNTAKDVDAAPVEKDDSAMYSDASGSDEIDGDGIRVQINSDEEDDEEELK